MELESPELRVLVRDGTAVPTGDSYEAISAGSLECMGCALPLGTASLLAADPAGVALSSDSLLAVAPELSDFTTAELVLALGATEISIEVMGLARARPVTLGCGLLLELTAPLSGGTLIPFFDASCEAPNSLEFDQQLNDGTSYESDLSIALRMGGYRVVATADIEPVLQDPVGFGVGETSLFSLPTSSGNAAELVVAPVLEETAVEAETFTLSLVDLDAGGSPTNIVPGEPLRVSVATGALQALWLDADHEASSSVLVSRQIDLDVAVVPACVDGLDNDGDGSFDFPDDPGCESAKDVSEGSPDLACDDGIDNDGDGRVDFDPLTLADPLGVAGSGDPGCRDPGSTLENPQCQDGVNNDGKFGTDFDGGLSAGGNDPNGADPQCVDRPWRNREKPNGCGLGFELAVLLPMLLVLRQRRRVC